MKSLQISNDTMRTNQLIKMIDEGKLVLESNYSEYSWNIIQKSNLILSMIHRVPINPVYLIETWDNYIVCDGIQRLYTIKDFVNNEFSLITHELEFKEKKFDDLINLHKNRIDDYWIDINIIKSGVDSDIKKLFNLINKKYYS